MEIRFYGQMVYNRTTTGMGKMKKMSPRRATNVQKKIIIITQREFSKNVRASAR